MTDTFDGNQEQKQDHERDPRAKPGRKAKGGPDPYGRTWERPTVGDVDMQLSVPHGLIPDGFKPYWFSDHIAGRIQRKIQEYWVPVTDSNGAAITQISGNGRLHLMMIEEKYYQEDEDLREKQYRASVTEVLDNTNLGDGVEAYKPSGDSKIKVSKDRDAFDI